MRLFFTLLIALLLLSCGSKHEGHRAGHAIKVVQAQPEVISLENAEPPVVYKVSDTRIAPFPMGKPTVVNLTSNVRRAGAPIVVKAGIPTVRIPGRDSCAFPTVVA
ncbi:MAG: hypothetical protein ACKO7B_21120, partial [Flavobacteriales bacterium]